MSTDQYENAANSVGLSVQEFLDADANTLSQLAYEAVINKNPHAEFITMLAAKAYKDQ